MPTLKDLLLAHDNDYRFDAAEVLAEATDRLPSLSVIVPYFESPATLPHVLARLARCIANARRLDPHWRYELIVVDDGSQGAPAAAVLRDTDVADLTLLLHEHNMGRTEARSTGLGHATHSVCLFVDADVLVDADLIANTLALFTRATAVVGRPPIVPAFFSNIVRGEGDYHLGSVRTVPHNDFRVACTYAPSWVGCEADLPYVGRSFHLLSDTRGFRTWRGKLAAWWLPNMVLGGCFAVDRVASTAVGGFDPRFRDYGFTETSLVTRLIAQAGHPVVPLCHGGAVHLAVNESPEERLRKDHFFRKAHWFYNEVFLNESAPR